MDSEEFELEGEFVRILFASLLQVPLLGDPCIRLEKELVYLWDGKGWIPVSVEDVVSVTVFTYAKLAEFSLRDVKGHTYIPLMNSGLSLKDLEDYFGKKLIVKESKFFKGGIHGDNT